MADSLPKKLKNDAIVDAVFEMRFEPPAGVLPEVFFGRFADHGSWRAFQQRRLPTADIPAIIRRTDPELKYQFSIQLHDKATNTHVRFGPNVLAFSRLPPYPGWSVFGPEIEEAVDVLFRAIPGVTVTRLGFRYINALRSDLHFAPGSEALKIMLQVGEARLTKRFNLTYMQEADDHSTVTVRIATSDLVQGAPPPNTTMAVDIDVGTNDGYRTTDASEIKSWVERAHICEKTHFFRLLADDVLDQLRVE